MGVGNLELKTTPGLISAGGLFVAGFILGLPGWKMDLFGFGLAAATLLFIFFMRTVKKEGQLAGTSG